MVVRRIFSNSKELFVTASDLIGRESMAEFATNRESAEGLTSSNAAPCESPEIRTSQCAWYCVRTKPKHDHIASANLRRNLGLEVFNPCLRIERNTRKGVRRLTEPLFPGYVFVRCSLEKSFDDIQHANGVAALVHFGKRVPRIADAIIEELQRFFPTGEPLPVQDQILPGEEVAMGDGPFTGMKAVVLRVLPARQRIEVLLEILGRPAPLELDWNFVIRENRNGVAHLAPVLVRRQDSIGCV